MSWKDIMRTVKIKLAKIEISELRARGHVINAVSPGWEAEFKIIRKKLGYGKNCYYSGIWYNSIKECIMATGKSNHELLNDPLFSYDADETNEANEDTKDTKGSEAQSQVRSIN